MYYNRSHGNNSTSSRSTSKAAPYEPNLFDDEELDGSIWDSAIEANESFDIFVFSLLFRLIPLVQFGRHGTRTSSLQGEIEPRQAR